MYVGSLWRLISLCVALPYFAAPSFGSGLVSVSAGGEPVGFDRDSLELVSGTIGFDPLVRREALAFDEDGRLYGVQSRELLEIHPQTLEVINRRPFLAHTLLGLAARGGRVYCFSGIGTNVVSFDTESLALVAGTLQNGETGGFNLCFDETGRLFGTTHQQVVEIDPLTLAILNRRVLPNPGTGRLGGLVATDDELIALTGGSGSLVAFDKDTLEVTRGAIEDGAEFGMALAIDNDGKVYGLFSSRVQEIDPVSLTVTREVTHFVQTDNSGRLGTLRGLAVCSLPLPDGELKPIRSVGRTTDGRIRVTISRVIRRQIGIEYSPDLSAGSWIELGNFSRAADGEAEFTDMDPARAESPRGYYRAFLRPVGG